MYAYMQIQQVRTCFLSWTPVVEAGTCHGGKEGIHVHIERIKAHTAQTCYHMKMTEHDSLLHIPEAS